MDNLKGFDRRDAEQLTSYVRGIKDNTVPRRRDGGPSAIEMAMIGDIARRISAEAHNHLPHYFRPVEIDLVQDAGHELHLAAESTIDVTAASSEKAFAQDLYAIAEKLRHGRTYDQVDPI